MSFSDRDGTIWSDGELIPWRDAKTHVLTHTLHYGLGVFEGVRAYATDRGPAIFRLQDHTQRLHNSAKILGMNMPLRPLPQARSSTGPLRPACEMADSIVLIKLEVCT